MSETHTEKMLDALADQFLTGTLPEKSAKDKSRHPSTDEELTKPIRLTPKTQSRHPQDPLPFTNSKTPPNLRLNQPELVDKDHNDDSPPLTSPPRVEAVFLGNLPTISGPWLTQYAHHLASQHGPIVIFHVDEEHIEIERVTCDHVSSQMNDHTGTTANPAALIQLIDELLASKSPAIATILINLPMPPTPLTLHVANQFDNWTLICGSDDAASVGAYRLLKQLSTQYNNQPDRPRHVSLAVMGSEQSKACTMAQHLNAVAANFLDLPIDLVGVHQRMVPVNTQSLGCYSASMQTWQQIASLLCSQKTEVTVDMANPNDKQDHPSATDRLQQLESELKDSRPPQAPPSLEMTRPESPSPQAPPPTNTPDLANFLVDSQMLQARCPRHPDIQLLLDEEGRLHLLCRHEGDATGLQSVIVDLIDSRAWVREHLQLLELTQRQMLFDRRAEPVLHIFIDQGKFAAAMAAKLGSFLKIHLLQEVRFGPSSSTWISTELN